MTRNSVGLIYPSLIVNYSVMMWGRDHDKMHGLRNIHSDTNIVRKFTDVFMVIVNILFSSHELSAHYDNILFEYHSVHKFITFHLSERR